MWVCCSWCKGRLKTWITVILIAQCFLVYFYLTFTSHPTSDSQSKKTDPQHSSTVGNYIQQIHKVLGIKSPTNTTPTLGDYDITKSRDAEIQSDATLHYDVIELESSTTPPRVLAQFSHLLSGVATDVKISKILHKPVRKAKSSSNFNATRTNSIVPKEHMVKSLLTNLTNSLLGHRTPRLTQYERLKILMTSHQNESKLRKRDSVKSKGLKGFNSKNTEIVKETGTHTHQTSNSVHIPKPESKSNTYKNTNLNQSNQSKNISEPRSIFDDFKPGIIIPHVFHLPQPTNVSELFHKDQHGEFGCFKEGIPATKRKPRHFGCLCKSGYHGKLCSIPNVAWYSYAARYMDSVTPRNRTRRIINALAFNIEWELLEARLNELNDTVDLFMIFESNISNYGESKPLRLGERLKHGYLKNFHHKILYLFCGEFPEEGRQDGWIIDQFQRTFIGTRGMKHVWGTRTDDIFIYTDADEIPSRESMLFLRIHDGYPEPFGFNLRWSVFGFFWKQLDTTQIMAGCTVGMLRYVYKYDAYELRTKANYREKYSRETLTYSKTGAILYDWYLGDNGVYAGWHCSWCLSPDRIRIKLESAINADFPRWGDYPEKLNLQYIRHLVKSGTWFDDNTRFGGLADPSSDPFYAPKHILRHNETYKNLINIEYV